MTTQEQSLRQYLKLDYIVAGLSLVLLVALTVLGVVMRYVVSDPLTWLEEAQATLIVWAVFFGGSVAFRKKCHIAIEIIVDSLPKKIQTAVHVMIFLVTVAVLVYMTVQGFNYISTMAKINRVTSVLQVPVQYIYIVFPVGCIFMLLNFLIVEIKALVKHFSKQAEGTQIS